MSAPSRAELKYLQDRFNRSKRDPTEVGAKPSYAAAGWKDKVEHWIGAHPHLCVGAALAVGVTIGWLVKRR